MKSQALFSLKDKSKKLKCRLLQFLFGVLRLDTHLFGVFRLDTHLFLGSMQTVKIQFRCRKMQHLTRVYTVKVFPYITGISMQSTVKVKTFARNP